MRDCRLTLVPVATVLSRFHLSKYVISVPYITTNHYIVLSQPPSLPLLLYCDRGWLCLGSATYHGVLVPSHSIKVMWL